MAEDSGEGLLAVPAAAVPTRIPRSDHTDPSSSVEQNITLRRRKSTQQKKKEKNVLKEYTLFQLLEYATQTGKSKEPKYTRFFFFFFFWVPHGNMEFPGQGSNPSWSCSLCHNCGIGISLTHCAGQGSNH